MAIVIKFWYGKLQKSQRIIGQAARRLYGGPESSYVYVKCALAMQLAASIKHLVCANICA